MKKTEIIENAATFECKETTPCGRSISISIGVEGVDAAYDQAVKAAAKYARIPGFRPGKAPASAVKSRCAEYITEEVERTLQQAGFAKFSAAKSKDIDIIAYGNMNAEVKPESGKSYSFTIEVEVAPKIEMPDWNAFVLPAIETKSEDERVNERLQYMKDMYADYVPVEGKTQEGDMLKVSYESDFVLPENASPALARAVKADEAWLHLSTPEQIPGMNAVLIGAEKGGEYSFAAVYGADWRQEELRGATVNYKVKINDGQRRKVLEDNAQLAEKLKAESVDKMMENFHAMAKNEMEEEVADKKRDAILADLLEKTPAFEMPASFLSTTTQREFNRIVSQLVRTEADVEPFKKEQDKHLADAKKAAEEYVRKFMIIRAVALANDISVSDEEIDMQIKMICAYTNQKEADLRKNLERNNGMSEIHEGLLMNKTLQFMAQTLEKK